MALSSESEPLPVRSTYRRLIEDLDRFPDPRTSMLLGMAAYSSLVQTMQGNRADVVLLDRYATSAAADAIALGMPPTTVMTLLSLFEPPDLTIVVDLDPVHALQRKAGTCSVAEAGGPEEVARYGSLQDAFIAYQGRVRTALVHIQNLSGPTRRTVVIDGAGGIDAVRAAMLASIDQAVDSAGLRPDGAGATWVR